MTDINKYEARIINLEIRWINWVDLLTYVEPIMYCSVPGM